MEHTTTVSYGKQKYFLGVLATKSMEHTITAMEHTTWTMPGTIGHFYGHYMKNLIEQIKTWKGKGLLEKKKT